MYSWQVISSLFLLSGIKLLVTTPSYALGSDLPLLIIAITSSLGASFSGIIFFFLGKNISRIIKPKPLQAKKIKRFRKIINVKTRFKSIGVSFLMGVLSVPIACLLVGKYFKNDNKAIVNIVIAAICWSFALTFVPGFFKFVYQTLFI